MRKLLLCAFLFLCCEFLNADNLDRVMPRSVQFNTGIIDLNSAQREVLYQWILKRYHKKEHDSTKHQSSSSGTSSPESLSNQPKFVEKSGTKGPKTYDDKDEHLTEVHLAENIDNGKFIRLSDNTLWEVDPIDVSRSELWLFPIPILVTKNNRTDFPYTLTNKNTGSKVDVRRIQSTTEEQNEKTNPSGSSTKSKKSQPSK